LVEPFTRQISLAFQISDRFYQVNSSPNLKL
jgi:hypothetical protein